MVVLRGEMKTIMNQRQSEIERLEKENAELKKESYRYYGLSEQLKIDKKYLKEELKKKDQIIEKAEKVIEFYALPIHWNDSGNLDYDMTTIDYDDVSVPDEFCDIRGGERARQYFKQKDEVKQ